MDIRQMIDASIETIEPSAQPRMKAAMELGARFALEAVLSRESYSPAAKEVRDQLYALTATEGAPV